MESIGEFLEQSRQSQGLTLEQVASMTRIQQRFIEALEKEDFGSLPERVFVKGFVRTYARSLGLDEEEVVQRFEESSRSFYEKREEARRLGLQRTQEDRKGKFNRNVVLVLTGAVLMGLVVFIYPYEQFSPPVPKKERSASKLKDTRGLERPEDQGEPLPNIPLHSAVTKDQQDNSVAVPSPVKPSSISAPPISPPSVSEQRAPSSGSEHQALENRHVREIAPPPSPIVQSGQVVSPVVVGEGELVLELQAMEMTWVVVKPDDGPPNEALLQPGETVIWKANDRFTLTLGNAGGVNVRLNGKPLGPFGKPGVVIRNLEIKP